MVYSGEFEHTDANTEKKKNRIKLKKVHTIERRRQQINRDITKVCIPIFPLDFRILGRYKKYNIKHFYTLSDICIVYICMYVQSAYTSILFLMIISYKLRYLPAFSKLPNNKIKERFIF